MIIYLSAAIAFILIVFFLLKKNTNSNPGSGNAQYLQKDDPNAQAAYNKIKFPSGPSFSAKELLELSWKFLYDITETVLNKFSVRDQQETMRNGRVLVEQGMKYQHVVDSNPKVVESYTKKSLEAKKDTSEKQR